jgi:hypothetical protein
MHFITSSALQEINVDARPLVLPSPPPRFNTLAEVDGFPRPPSCRRSACSSGCFKRAAVCRSVCVCVRVCVRTVGKHMSLPDPHHATCWRHSWSKSFSARRLGRGPCPKTLRVWGLGFRVFRSHLISAFLADTVLYCLMQGVHDALVHQSE